MDGIQLYQEIDQKMAMLEEAIRQLKARGIALSTAEREYRVAKAEAILEERAKGTPATLTADIVKGRRDIAKLCFERDCAQVVYDSAKEYIMVVKKEVTVLENQIQREWEQARRM